MAAASGSPSSRPLDLSECPQVLSFLSPAEVARLGATSRLTRTKVSGEGPFLDRHTVETLLLRGTPLTSLALEAHIVPSFVDRSATSQLEFLRDYPAAFLKEYVRRLSAQQHVDVPKADCERAFVDLSSAEQSTIFAHVTDPTLGREMLGWSGHQIPPEERVEFLMRCGQPPTDADFAVFTEAEWNRWMERHSGAPTHGAAARTFLQNLMAQDPELHDRIVQGMFDHASQQGSLRTLRQWPACQFFVETGFARVSPGSRKTFFESWILEQVSRGRLPDAERISAHPMFSQVFNESAGVRTLFKDCWKKDPSVIDMMPLLMGRLINSDEFQRLVLEGNILSSLFDCSRARPEFCFWSFCVGLVPYLPERALEDLFFHWRSTYSGDQRVALEGMFRIALEEESRPVLAMLSNHGAEEGVDQTLIDRARSRAIQPTTLLGRIARVAASLRELPPAEFRARIIEAVGASVVLTSVSYNACTLVFAAVRGAISLVHWWIDAAGATTPE